MARFVTHSFLLATVLLSSCALLPARDEIPPTAEQLIGRYEFGHTGFHETVVLAQDRSFTRTLHPHLSDHSVTYEGTWSLEGKMLHFAYSPESDAGAESLAVAEVFWHNRAAAFVNADDLEGEKVHEWWVYEWRGAE